MHTELGSLEADCYPLSTPDVFGPSARAAFGVLELGSDHERLASRVEKGCGQWVGGWVVNGLGLVFKVHVAEMQTTTYRQPERLVPIGSSPFRPHLSPARILELGQVVDGLDPQLRQRAVGPAVVGMA